MASLIGRAMKLAQSPAGKRLLVEAQKAARDPRNRARVEQARQRVSRGTARKTAEPTTSTEDTRKVESNASEKEDQGGIAREGHEPAEEGEVKG